jgi:aquaporin NIP
MKKYISEFIGTFALVFCGTGAIIIDNVTHGAVSHVGVAFTFGLIVTAMIYSFGETSGAHLNPAVTIAFVVAGKFNKSSILPYIISQLAGAFAASVILKVLFPADEYLGSTIPSGSYLQSFILEFILTWLLMLVILNVSQGSKETGTMAGIAIGSTVLLEAMFAGPICGASMNPARSLAPAVVSGNIQPVWIYLVAPIAGALFASLTWRMLNNTGRKKLGFQ